MKKELSQFFVKLQRFFQPKKVVGKIQTTITGNIIVIDFRMNQPSTLQDHLDRYYSCPSSIMKEYFLLEMYNAGFIDKAIELYEVKNGLINTNELIWTSKN